MNAKQISEKKYRDLLKDCEVPCKDKYCFFRMYMEKQHLSIFIILQVKLMEKMKYIWETKDGKDYGFNYCSMKWNDDKFAEAYRMAFDEADDSEDVEAIFKRTLEIQKKLIDKPKDL